MDKDIQIAIDDDPQFQDLVKEVPIATEDTEPPIEDDSNLPGGSVEYQTEPFDAEAVMEFWRTGSNSLDALTIDEVITAYQREKKVTIERMTWEPCKEFSLSHMAINGFVEQTAKISDDLQVTFRSISIEDAKKIEERVLKYIRDTNATETLWRMESLMKSLPHSWVAINGSPIETLAKEKFPELQHETAIVSRERFIATLAQELIDQISMAYSEFRRRTTLMLRGVLRGN